MPRFRFRGVDAQGHPVEGEREANEPEDLLARLAEEGIEVHALHANEGRRTIRADDAFALFNAELAALLDAGVPLERALRTLADSMRKGRLREAALEIERQLEGGVSLAMALHESAYRFPLLYTSLVRAGIESGDLPGALRRVAEFSARAAAHRRAFFETIAYPLLLLAMGLALCIWIVWPGPFASDPSYAFLRAMGQATAGTWSILREGVARLPFILAGLLAASAAALLATRIASPDAFDGILARLPIYGHLFRTGYLSRFFRSLGDLLRSGVPLERGIALLIASEEGGGLRMGRGRVLRALREGRTLAEALRGHPIFPPFACWLLEGGQARGELSDSLEELGRIYGERHDSAWQLLRALAPPAVIAAVGAIMIIAVLASYARPAEKMVELLQWL